MGLNEQANDASFDFIQTANAIGLYPILESLNVQTESHSHSNLLMWIVKVNNFYRYKVLKYIIAI